MCVPGMRSARLPWSSGAKTLAALGGVSGCPSTCSGQRYLPVLCSDVSRPFPVSLEFASPVDIKSFTMAAQQGEPPVCLGCKYSALLCLSAFSCEGLLMATPCGRSRQAADAYGSHAALFSTPDKFPRCSCCYLGRTSLSTVDHSWSPAPCPKAETTNAERSVISPSPESFIVVCLHFGPTWGFWRRLGHVVHDHDICVIVLSRLRQRKTKGSFMWLRSAQGSLLATPSTVSPWEEVASSSATDSSGLFTVWDCAAPARERSYSSNGPRPERSHDASNARFPARIRDSSISSLGAAMVS